MWIEHERHMCAFHFILHLKKCSWCRVDPTIRFQFQWKTIKWLSRRTCRGLYDQLITCQTSRDVSYIFIQSFIIIICWCRQFKVLHSKHHLVMCIKDILLCVRAHKYGWIGTYHSRHIFWIEDAQVASDGRWVQSVCWVPIVFLSLL